MILADKIINERKKNGWSQEELAEKLSVSRQSVSKWESAQSVPDLQKVIQLSDIFGVSIDYLLKDEIGEAPAPTALREESKSEPPRRWVSMEEANRYMASEKERAPKIARGVALCILSPVVLLLLTDLAHSGRFGISEGLAAGIGVGVLLALVAAAVAVFILSGSKGEKFGYIEKECFETEYGVTSLVRERLEAFAQKYVRMITLGVVLCILSVLPLVVTSSLGAGDAVILAMVCLLLAFVAAAVYLFIYAGIIKNSYDALLQENEFSAAEKESSRRLDLLSGIYWGLATAVYLAVSFITMRWDATWIVWPVAGVLFGVVFAVAKQVIRKNDR